MGIRRWIQRLGGLLSFNRLFVKIFLWFWASAWVVLVVVTAANFFNGMQEVKPPSMFATVAPILAEDAVRAYETGGAAAFAHFSQANVDDEKRKLYLVDSNFHDVLGRPITSNGMRVVRAAKPGHILIFRRHVAGLKITSAAGHEYVVLLYISAGLKEVFIVLVGMGLFRLMSLLAMVTVFCLLLAYHISNPIHAVQLAARQVSLGDLSARAPAFVTRRHDEVASLGQDFNAMVDRIEVLVTSHQHLLASVSHEVRSPLTRLTLSLAMLQRRADDRPGIDHQITDLLDRMHRDIAAMDRLMGQLLTLSRFEAGLSAEHRAEVDLSLMLHQICADAAFEAEATDKHVEAIITEGILLRQADSYALRSAFENIIRNAIRFTAPGSCVEVELTLPATVNPREAQALLTVSDQGPGVSEDLLETIFKPFFRAPSAQDLPGNGLGLAIAAQAVRLHQGTIVASNIVSSNNTASQAHGLRMQIALPLYVRRFTARQAPISAADEKTLPAPDAAAASA